MNSIIFHPEAENEFREAVGWYAIQQKGLDIEFIRCIDEAVQKIERNPELYPIEFGHFRKKVVKRFPFIVFEILKNTIFILAVFHSRRNPEVIKTRLQ
ncbi:MAG: type II toxin-antitoxin system RelE/ParE family toxin [Ignavibacteriaceae bacterium]